MFFEISNRTLVICLNVAAKALILSALALGFFVMFNADKAVPPFGWIVFAVFTVCMVPLYWECHFPLPSQKRLVTSSNRIFAIVVAATVFLLGNDYLYSHYPIKEDQGFVVNALCRIFSCLDAFVFIVIFAGFIVLMKWLGCQFLGIKFKLNYPAK